MNTEPTATSEALDTGAALPQESGNSPVDIADLLGIGEEDNQQQDEPKLGPDGKPLPVEAPASSTAPLDKPAVAASVTEQKPAPIPDPTKPLEPTPGNDDLKKLLTEVLAERKPAEPEKPAAPAAEEYKPKYTPNIPDQIMQALEHEDPAVRKQGMAAMIGGAMNRVFEDLRKEFKAELTTFQTQVPTLIAQRENSQKAAETMRTDFYGSYPEFGETPKQRQFVAMVAIQVAQSMGDKYKGYTPEFKAALEREVRALTGIQPKVAPAPKAPGAKKPGAPAIDPKTNTRAADAGQQSLADEIAETISFN